jgi:hypothetical protein
LTGFPGPIFCTFHESSGQAIKNESDRIQIMKSIPHLCFLFFSLLIVCSSISAQDNSQAESLFNSDQGWSSGLGLPIAYSFKKAEDGDSLKGSGPPAGLIITLVSPYHFGFGFEYYRIKLENEFSQSGTLNRLSITMLNLSYSLDLRFLVVALGAGVGAAWIEGDKADLVRPTPSSQFFLRTGTHVNDRIDINLGLHRVSAQLQLKNSDSLLEAGGIMISTGINAEF